MSSEEISTIAMEPFIRKFVYAIIKTIRQHNFDHEEKHVIHADLVPRFSPRVFHAYPVEKRTPPVNQVRETTIPKHQHRDMSALIAPINNKPVKRGVVPAPKPAVIREPRQGMPVPQKPLEINRPADVPLVSGEAKLSHDYGKITPLLNDPSVSSIECQGADKPLMIIRVGQRQVTRITLSAEEIKKILQTVSDSIHIPLLEGVFRAAVDNFSINAVISEMIGSRFVIKKETAYALLE